MIETWINIDGTVLTVNVDGTGSTRGPRRGVTGHVTLANMAIVRESPFWSRPRREDFRKSKQVTTRGRGMKRRRKVSTKDVVRWARDLRSDDGSNPEYDRALVELTAACLGWAPDDADALVLGIDAD